MIKIKFEEIFEKYNIENTPIGRNIMKCMIRAMKKQSLSDIKGQYCYIDTSTFEYLIEILIKLNKYFDFFYSLKSDLILMFEYLINAKLLGEKISFNAFFCPGYNMMGGYKEMLGNTTVTKLSALSEISKMFSELKVPYEINCYYCDTFIENTDTTKNKNWKSELELNRSLFIVEAQKYFDDKNIFCISKIKQFQCDNVSGYIDYNVVGNVPHKIYNSFYVANKVFYEKMNYSAEKIKDRNDTLVTMYIIVSNYINAIKNGVYLPMENMYDREKIIANNGTCTMYLKQNKGKG